VQFGLVEQGLDSLRRESACDAVEEVVQAILDAVYKGTVCARASSPPALAVVEQAYAVKFPHG
jgi:hypothetical protein